LTWPVGPANTPGTREVSFQNAGLHWGGASPTSPRKFPRGRVFSFRRLGCYDHGVVTSMVFKSKGGELTSFDLYRPEAFRLAKQLLRVSPKRHGATHTCHSHRFSVCGRVTGPSSLTWHRTQRIDCPQRLRNKDCPFDFRARCMAAAQVPVTSKQVTNRRR